MRSRFGEDVLGHVLQAGLVLLQVLRRNIRDAEHKQRTGGEPTPRRNCHPNSALLRRSSTETSQRAGEAMTRRTLTSNHSDPTLDEEVEAELRVSASSQSQTSSFKTSQHACRDEATPEGVMVNVRAGERKRVVSVKEAELRPDGAFKDAFVRISATFAAADRRQRLHPVWMKLASRAEKETEERNPPPPKRPPPAWMLVILTRKTGTDRPRAHKQI